MFFPSDLESKDLNDYKNFKAYSYYKSDWLQPLFYHCLDTHSKFCIMKAGCRKSQNIRDTYHKTLVDYREKNC